MKENNLLDRTFYFGVNTLKFLRTLPVNEELKAIKYQLIKSSTSVGANYEEAQGTSSKADFNNKVRIVLKEVRESNYWFRILSALEYNSETLEKLVQESKELKKYFWSNFIKRHTKKLKHLPFAF